MDKQIKRKRGEHKPSSKPRVNKPSQIIYLEVDINQTEKRIKQYAKTYNQELHHPEFLEEQYQRHITQKVQVQKSVKSLSIKSTHITTAIAITKAYYKNLKNIEKGKFTQCESFRLNNKALATLTGMSDRSARRHVNKLLATGFLQEKVFRGTNTSFEIKIHPEFLVARPNEQLTEILLNQHAERYPGMPINPVTFKHYTSLRPSFSDIPSGILRSVCPVIEINPETFNNNILAKGIVDNSGREKGKRPQKLTVINNAFNNPEVSGKPEAGPEQADRRYLEEEKQPFQQKILREKPKNFPAALFTTIFFYTDLAWNFARSLLYDNREFQPEQEQAAKSFIAGILIEYAKNNDPRKLAQCYNEFIVTSQIVKDYTNRKIEWQLARPEYFFDPKFKGGFHRAFKEWLPRHKEKQKKKKDWNSNKKLVATLFRYYSSNPNHHRYMQCINRLGRLKNKKFLDTFNACVLDKEKFNHQFLNQTN